MESTEQNDNTVNAVHELLDQDHPRSSVSDGSGKILLEPSKALHNIAAAMESVDADIDTPVSIEDDVLSLNELHGLIHGMLLGPTLAVHVVNTGMRIMSARYPADLVTRPFPEEYDLRIIHPALELTETQHDIAKAVFNRRSVTAGDLTEDDVPEVGNQPKNDQMSIFVALFMMYGTKVGAMKHRTGIE